MSKATELRQKTDDELKQTLMDLYREQFNLRMQKSGAPIKQHTQFRVIRREIARIKTIQTERQKAV